VRVLVALLLAFGLTMQASWSHADDLDDKKKRIATKIDKSQRDLHDYENRAAEAAAALQTSQTQLASSEAQLAQAQAAEAEAQDRDAQAAANLQTAQQQLAVARKEAKAAAARVDAWMKVKGREVVRAQQQRTDVQTLSVFTSNIQMGRINQRVHLGGTMLSKTQEKLDTLRTLQFQRDAAREKATQKEAEVRKLRLEAQQAYQDSQDATAASAAARDQHADAVAQNEEAKQAADQQVEAEKKNQEQLQSESRAVEKRIQERIAREKAEAERRRKEEAARRAREAAEKARREKQAREAAARAAAAEAAARKASAAKKAAAQKAAREAREQARQAEARAKQKSSSRPKAPTSTYSNTSSRPFIYPSGAVITSPFGMRFHPVLRYWKLHDGTDFGASCGTPIRAAAAGRVSESYYNAGYGNRMIIDHGTINGRYVTTSYNHAIRYVVSPGQHVQQGQLIGYVGTTGYSTGCHLHFMAWVNGKLVNPMTLY